MPEVKGVSEDQANEALQQLIGGNHESEDDQQVEVPEHSVVASAEAEPGVEQVAGEAADDDLESLRQRNKDLEAARTEAETRFEARMKAHQDRSAANEQILRDRYLRKSTASDKALSVLRATKSESGVTTEDVEQAIREIEGTMNPQSASYAPQHEYVQTATAPVYSEDQAITINSFLNDKGMTKADADQFGNWIKTESGTVMSQAEQAVANQSLDGFLRLAHTHWNRGLREKEKDGVRSDAIGAVRSVQRTQREAAKAASTSPRAPQKQPAASPVDVDVSKFTDDDISSLLRQSVEQYSQ